MKTAAILFVLVTVSCAAPLRAQTLVVDTTTISLGGNVNSNTCSTQTRSITSSVPSQSLPITTAVNMPPSRLTGWLSVTLSSNSTPATLTVTCLPLDAAGDSSAEIQISSVLASNSPVTIGVSLIDDRGENITVVSNAFVGSVVKPLSPNMIASLWGVGMATGTSVNLYPGTSFNGTSVSVIDSTGASQTATLFYVSPGLINFLIPGVATGPAAVHVNRDGQVIGTETIQLNAYAPGFFGAGNFAAASAIRTDGKTNTSINVVQCPSPDPSNCTAVPIDVSIPGTKVILSLYGTGIHSPGLGNVFCVINSVYTPVLYAGPQGDFAGLDQINVQIPASLQGSGNQQILCKIAGATDVYTNSPLINIQ